MRSEHWTNAVDQSATAARTLLTGVSSPIATKPPYFWSDQYDARIQFAGHARPGDELIVIDGDPAADPSQRYTVAAGRTSQCSP